MLNLFQALKNAFVFYAVSNTMNWVKFNRTFAARGFYSCSCPNSIKMKNDKHVRITCSKIEQRTVVIETTCAMLKILKT